MLGITLGLYIGTLLLLNIPFIQQKMTSFIANELSTLLKTNVEIGKINIGLLNRIIVDDMLVEDQAGKEMVKVTRLSVKFDLLPLVKGRVSISNIQLFGFDIALNKTTPQADPNFGFVLKAFASKDSVKTESKLDVRVNSLLIRRGKFSYNVLSEEETPGKFNPNHVSLYNIIANISLKALQNDSINAQIKRLSFDDHSGFELQKLNMKVLGSENKLSIENFAVGLPNTSLRMDTIHASYDSLASFKNFVTDVRFSLNVLPSYVTLQDISPFVPVLENFKERIELDELEAGGTLDQLNCSKLSLSAAKNSLQIRGNVALQDLSNPTNAFVYGNLSKLSVNRQGVDFLVRNFSKAYEQTPAVLQRLGDLSFNGEVSGYFTDLVMYGVFQTGLGRVNTDVKISSNREKGVISYSGGLKTEEFELGTLLDESKLGKITFNFDVKSTHVRNRYPDVILKGLIASIDYSDYQYNNISLDGEYKNGGFDGKVMVDDENGAAHLNGSFNISEKVPVFNFRADLIEVHPHELNLLLDEYKGTNLSMILKANFSGGSIDEMIGSIAIDSMSFVTPEKEYYLEKMALNSTRAGSKSVLTLNSAFMDARVEGSYTYRTLLHSILNTVKKYVPSLFPPDNKKEVVTNNNFSFDINIYDTDILPAVFNIPFKVYTHSMIKGYFNDQLDKMRFEGYFPRFQYGKMFIESGMILCENTAEHLRGRVRLSNHRKHGIVNLSLDTQAKGDKLDTRISWGNNGEVTYSGDFATLASFSRTNGGDAKKSMLKAIIDVKPTEIILNDTVWNIHPSHVEVDSGRVHVDNFHFSHGEQFLRINGYASEAANDTVKMDLNDINIAYVFDIFNLRSVDFDGYATGRAIGHQIMKNPVMNTRLFIRDFRFNSALLGDMDIYGEWDRDEEGILLNAHIREEGLSESFVDGHIYPLRPKSGLDLNIKTSNVNIGFIETYLESIMSNIKGRATGNMRLFGKFSALNLDGQAKADATFKVNILNTYFAIKDSVNFTPREISFKKLPVYDLEGHQGVVDGYIRHQNFKEMRYRIGLESNNLLVMKTTDFDDMPFYGTIYGTGTALLTGDNQGLNIDAAITTNRNTTFVYSISSAASATNSQFIRFVDKTPNRIDPDSLLLLSGFDLARQQQKKEEKELDTDIRLNIQIDATPDASMRIIMDPVSGDYISARGSGSVRLEFFNKGDVKMFGNYTINQGVYKFSLQEVFRRDFTIKDGSNIVFNGDPYNATMDVQAAYAVNSASLNDLIPEDVPGKPTNVNVRVSCILNLSGILTNPTIKLDLELPNEKDETKALVRNYISTEEEMNMQILYLLGIGKFYPPAHLSTSQNSNVMSSVLSSTLSGQLNNVLSQIVDNGNWNIGTNLSTGDKGWTDVEVEGILSGRLLNNRLLINGNFGYRDNPMATTNFVGDFQAEWLLTRSGDIRLKAYNETNDRYYTRTNLTTQGIGIMYKKDFSRWNELFFWRNWAKKKKENEAKKNEEEEEEKKEIPAPAPEVHPTDSITSWINFR